MGLRCGLRLVSVEMLVSGEGKEFVAKDRTAKCAAVLVLVQRVLRSGEEVGGVDVVVADELKKRTVVGVGSRASNDVYQAASMLAVRCPQAPWIPR